MLLEVKNLETYYRTEEGVVKAVNAVTFSIQKNEIYGLVGESGCGKSTIAKSIMRLLPPNGEVVRGEIVFKGTDLVSLKDKEMRNILWEEISMVTQSAMNSLNPVYKVGDQIREAIQAHKSISKSEALDRVRELFELVGLDEQMMSSYPHEFSGGMKQRSIIAMALALKPSLIIMDEPTTGLDVLVQDRILRRLSEIQKQVLSSILLITHDVSVIAEMCNRVGVMYAGQLMEEAENLELFNKACHPYTLGLQNAFPSVQAMDRELISIPGSPPGLINLPAGCSFTERCPFSTPKCSKERPIMYNLNETHLCACHYISDKDKVNVFRKAATYKETWQ